MRINENLFVALVLPFSSRPKRTGLGGGEPLLYTLLGVRNSGRRRLLDSFLRPAMGPWVPGVGEEVRARSTAGGGDAGGAEPDARVPSHGRPAPGHARVLGST